MAKIHRIYYLDVTKAPPPFPNWPFPQLFVLLGTFGKMGRAVVQPISKRGSPTGKPRSLNLEMLRYYRLMPEGQTSELLSKKEIEAMATEAGL